MVFCLINLIGIICLALCFRKKSNLQWKIVFIGLFFLSAFRAEGMGADYYSYEKLYKAFLAGDYLGYEPLYIMLNIICSHFGGYRVVVVTVAALSLMGPIRYIKKNSAMPILSLWLYISMGFYLWTFTIYRQAIAISFALFA